MRSLRWPGWQPVWWQLPERRSRSPRALPWRLPLPSELHWPKPSELRSLWRSASRSRLQRALRSLRPMAPQWLTQARSHWALTSPLPRWHLAKPARRPPAATSFLPCHALAPDRPRLVRLPVPSLVIAQQHPAAFLRALLLFLAQLLPVLPLRARLRLDLRSQPVPSSFRARQTSYSPALRRVLRPFRLQAAVPPPLVLQTSARQQTTSLQQMGRLASPRRLLRRTWLRPPCRGLFQVPASPRWATLRRRALARTRPLPAPANS